VEEKVDTSFDAAKKCYFKENTFVEIEGRKRAEFKKERKRKRGRKFSKGKEAMEGAAHSNAIKSIEK